MSAESEIRQSIRNVTGSTLCAYEQGLGAECSVIAADAMIEAVRAHVLRVASPRAAFDLLQAHADAISATIIGTGK